MSGRTLKKQRTTRRSELQSSNENDQQAQIIAQKVEGYSGPIPSPDMMEKYENLSPGFANRILSMAEKQADHRMNAENKMIEIERQDSKRGSWFAFLLGVGSLISAVFIVYLERSAAGAIGGSILGTSGITFLAINFIKRK